MTNSRTIFRIDANPAVSVLPNYHLYMKASNAMVDIIKEYSPSVQKFSIDECFVHEQITINNDISPFWPMMV